MSLRSRCPTRVVDTRIIRRPGDGIFVGASPLCLGIAKITVVLTVLWWYLFYSACRTLLNAAESTELKRHTTTTALANARETLIR